MCKSMFALFFVLFFLLRHSQVVSSTHAFVGMRNHYLNKSYFLDKSTSSFDEALRACQEVGGQIVVISGEYENFFVGKMLGNLYAWLGVRSDSWDAPTWLDGSPMSFSNWADRQPDYGDGKLQ